MCIRDSFTQYWSVLENFVRMGPECREYLLQTHAIKQTLHLFLGSSSPDPKNRVTVDMGDEWENPNWRPLMSVLSILVRSCEFPRTSIMRTAKESDSDSDNDSDSENDSVSGTSSAEAAVSSGDEGSASENQTAEDGDAVRDDGDSSGTKDHNSANAIPNNDKDDDDDTVDKVDNDDEEDEEEEEEIEYPETQLDGEVMEMNEEDRSFLSSEEFLTKVLRLKNKTFWEEIVQILTHVMWQNKEMSTMILQVIKDVTTSASYDKLNNVFRILGPLLNDICDDYQKYRVESTLAELLIIFKNKKRLPKSSEKNLTFLIHVLYDHNPLCKAYLDERKEELDWIIMWINRHQASDVRMPDWAFD
eukprot:TRINITY_DN769_c0_g1_i2.p1 TRINITY_DN769_c0_g1~~TRINITY_DN769_c0_g1_i2.p1  ORF type:complete len:360 (+),score=77.12 TRINITY_DN769_c0_g1_i2:60-1139(+)